MASTVRSPVCRTAAGRAVRRLRPGCNSQTTTVTKWLGDEGAPAGTGRVVGTGPLLGTSRALGRRTALRALDRLRGTGRASGPPLARSTHEDFAGGRLGACYSVEQLPSGSWTVPSRSSIALGCISAGSPYAVSRFTDGQTSYSAACQIRAKK